MKFQFISTSLPGTHHVAPLKLGNGYVISLHTFCGCNHLSMPIFKFIHVSKEPPDIVIELWFVTCKFSLHLFKNIKHTCQYEYINIYISPKIGSEVRSFSYWSTMTMWFKHALLNLFFKSKYTIIPIKCAHRFCFRFWCAYIIYNICLVFC